MRPQDELISFIGDVRYKLCKNGFYSPDKLDYLAQLLVSHDGDRIESFSVDYKEKNITIKYKIIPGAVEYYWYRTKLSEFFLEYKSSLYSIFQIDDLTKLYSNPPDLFCYINYFGNTVTIKL